MNDLLSIVEKRASVRKLGEHEQCIIAEMADATIDLVTNHYKEINSVRKDNETASAQVSIQFTLGYDNGSAKVNTVISFSKKFRDGREGIIGDPRQTKLFNNKGEPSEEAQPLEPSKKSKKSKK